MKPDGGIGVEETTEETLDSLKKFLAKQLLHTAVTIIVSVGVYAVLDSVLPMPKKDLNLLKRITWAIGTGSIAATVSAAAADRIVSTAFEAYDVLEVYLANQGVLPTKEQEDIVEVVSDSNVE